MRRSNVWPVSSVIGDRVHNLDGENLGKIEDVAIDPVSGIISFAILSFGSGFPAAGDKLFAVPWQCFRMSDSNDYLVLDLDKETLRQAPGFDRDNWPNMTDPAWQSRMYKFYGRTDVPPTTERLTERRMSSEYDERPVEERRIVVEREGYRSKGISALAAVFVVVLLLAALWGVYRVSTQGWEQTRKEMVQSLNGAAYAMKETSSDAALTTKIQTAYSMSRRIPRDAKINVDSENGIVTLRGDVPSADVSRNAEEIATDIVGVQEVINHLYVGGGGN